MPVQNRDQVGCKELPIWVAEQLGEIAETHAVPETKYGPLVGDRPVIAFPSKDSGPN